jgi:hypothetical protein
VTVALTNNFFAKARGLTLLDSAQIVWSINKNTNEITATAAGALGGTVTSVGLADGSTAPIYTISGSPVVGAGTLTFTLATKAANLVFAGPTSGGLAQPTFRGLVIADLPTAIPNANLANSSVTVSAGTGLTGGGTATLGGAAVTLSLSTPVSGTNGGTGVNNGASTITVGGSITFSGAFTFTGTLTATTSVTFPTSGTLATTAQLPVAANPTGLIGLSAVNGVAATFDRSDSTHALDQSISPTWTGNHTFTPSSGTAITCTGSGVVHAIFGTLHIATSLNYDAGDSEIYNSGSANLTISAFGSLKLRAGNAIAVVFDSVAQTAAFTKAIGVNNVAPPAQVTGWGTPVGGAVVLNYNITDAGGANSNTNKAVAKIIADLKAIGFYAA